MVSSPTDDAVMLHYQPWLDGNDKAAGLEALVRWHHHDRGSISPEAFIPVFEESGLITSLFHWSLNQACTDAVSWTEPLLVTLTLSPLQFAEPNLTEVVASVLATTGLSATRLELAISEAALLADDAGSTLVDLDALGVRLAFDNFSTSGTALSSLEDHPFSKLKIEGSFIAEVERSSSARWIVRTLIDFGHSLDLVVAAEGVDAPGQRSFLIEQGCDLMQGLALGSPAPVESFTAHTGGPTVPAHALDFTATPFAAPRDFEEAGRKRGTA